MMDYTEMFPTIEAMNVPEDAVGEFKDFIDKLNNKYTGMSITEYAKMELNREVEEFKQYLNEKYRYNNFDYIAGNTEEIDCKLEGGLAYHNVTWTVEDIKRVYQKYYSDRFEDKNEYTRLEVNNMLFNLSIADVIDDYECVALPYSIAEDYNNELFDGLVHVKARYNI